MPSAASRATNDSTVVGFVRVNRNADLISEYALPRSCRRASSATGRLKKYQMPIPTSRMPPNKRIQNCSRTRNWMTSVMLKPAIPPYSISAAAAPTPEITPDLHPAPIVRRMHKTFTGPTGMAIIRPTMMPPISNSIALIRRLSPRMLFRARRAHFDTADHGSRRHAQHQRHRFGHVFRCDHPACVAGALGGVARELRVHAARHDATDPNVVVTVVEHHGFAESVESEFGCVVARAAAERILPREAGNIDDEPAAALGEAFQRLPGTIERPVQIEVDIAMPLLRRHLGHLPEDPFAGVIDQNVQPTEFPVHRLE